MLLLHFTQQNRTGTERRERVLFSWHWSCKVSLSRRGNVAAMAAAMCVSLQSPHCAGGGSWSRSIAGNLCNQRRDGKLGRTQKTQAWGNQALYKILIPNTWIKQYCTMQIPLHLLTGNVNGKTDRSAVWNVLIRSGLSCGGTTLKSSSGRAVALYTLHHSAEPRGS